MEKSIGGLWIKDGKSGKFFSGNIEIGGEKKRITIFRNDYKKDNQPDYRIYESKINSEQNPEDNYIPNDEFQPLEQDDLPF